MKTMAAADFKARCLRVMDEVNKRREPVVITKKGKPVAKLVPIDSPQEGIFGCGIGTARILGDIESPVVPPEEWEAIRDPDRVLRGGDNPPRPARTGARRATRRGVAR